MFQKLIKVHHDVIVSVSGIHKNNYGSPGVPGGEQFFGGPHFEERTLISETGLAVQLNFLSGQFSAIWCVWTLRLRYYYPSFHQCIPHTQHPTHSLQPHSLPCPILSWTFLSLRHNSSICIRSTFSLFSRSLCRPLRTLPRTLAAIPRFLL